MWWFKNRTPRPEPADGEGRERSLSMRPVRNRHVRETILEGGLVRLDYPVAVKPWFAGLAKRFGAWDGRPVSRALELDEMGSFCWNLIDAERSVRQMAGELAGRYKLPPREAEMAVAAFLRELGRRGVVGFREATCAD